MYQGSRYLGAKAATAFSAS